MKAKFKELKSEFKKIKWLSKVTLFKQVALIVCVSVVICLMITVFDNAGLALVNLISKI